MKIFSTVIATTLIMVAITLFPLQVIAGAAVVYIAYMLDKMQVFK